MIDMFEELVKQCELRFAEHLRECHGCEEAADENFSIHDVREIAAGLRAAGTNS